MAKGDKRGNKRVLILAVILGLISAGGVYSYLAKQSSAATVRMEKVIVAKKDISARTPITAAMLEEKEIPEGTRHPSARGEPDVFLGKVTKQTISAGEQVLTTKIFAQRGESGLAFIVPPNQRAISVQVTEVIGSGGLIAPGDKVDVIGICRTTVDSKKSSASDGGETKEIAKAVTALQTIEVLAVGQNIAGEEPTSVSDKLVAKPENSGERTADPNANPKAKSVTLSVTPDQAQKLVLYDELCELRLALRSSEDRAVVTIKEEELSWDRIRSAY